jgi:hypothetical protein
MTPSKTAPGRFRAVRVGDEGGSPGDASYYIYDASKTGAVPLTWVKSVDPLDGPEATIMFYDAAALAKATSVKIKAPSLRQAVARARRIDFSIPEDDELRMWDRVDTKFTTQASIIEQVVELKCYPMRGRDHQWHCYFEDYIFDGPSQESVIAKIQRATRFHNSEGRWPDLLESRW